MVRGRPQRRPLAVTALAEAYSATAAAWRIGPALIYDRLAEVLVAHSPVLLGGTTILDVGAGTGAAARAARAAGATQVVAVDAAFGMLAHDPGGPTAAVGDVRSLPFRAAAFDASVAAFVLNHLSEPVEGLAEMRRVTRRGGAVLAAVYAADDSHPAKVAVEAALVAAGWTVDPWFSELRSEALPKLATVDACRSAMRAAGLEPLVTNVRVAFPEVGSVALVEWRLGLAQHAPFVAGLPPAARQDVVDDAVARLGDRPEPLVRSILVMAATTN